MSVHPPPARTEVYAQTLPMPTHVTVQPAMMETTVRTVRTVCVTGTLYIVRVKH